MGINKRGLDLIKHFEGLVLKAYLDPVGIWTIGYGHTGPDVYPGRRISAEEANEILEDDLKEHEAFVSEVVDVDLNPNQFAALVSFAFNVGNGSFRKSTLLKKVKAKQFAAAADEFLKWVYGTIGGKKVKLKGLVRRRNAERGLFLSKATTLDVPGLEITSGPLPSESDLAAAAAEDEDREFTLYVQSLGLRHFKPYEFLVLGHQHNNPDSAAYGLNGKPPKKLWGNIAQTARVLDRLRELLDAPIVTLSVYRTPAYNGRIGGAKKSQHLQFTAVDFLAKSISGPPQWADALRQIRGEEFFKGGIGTYGSFVHVDTRGQNADWSG